MSKLITICAGALLCLVSCGGHYAPAELSPPPPTLYGEYNTEEYDHISENEFLGVVSHPLSTFSIDVDAASYSNIRRFINSHRLPPADAVRIEELINYFSYDYPEPVGEHPFSITTELSTCPWNEHHRLVHIGLQGRRMPVEHLPPANLVFLLDVSGSMDYPNKLPLLKSAFRLLVEQLRDEDRVAIVVYAGASGLALPSTPGSDKETILEAIDELRAGGSTAGASGIRLAYQIARENFREEGNNRVILATDGDFNVGVSSDAELVRLIDEKRQLGVYLTVLGFGTGNLKDSKLEKLADKGNGAYAYIDNIREARKVLVSELGGTLFTIAKDVKVQVEFNPLKVSAYRLVGYENRLLDKQDFDDDTKDAGEMGSGHSVTVLYELVPADTDDSRFAADSLRYQVTAIRPGAMSSPELMTLKFRYKWPDDSLSRRIVQPVIDSGVVVDETSDDFRFAAAVAGFGMLLRNSEFKGSTDFDSVHRLASGAMGHDDGGYRHEFLNLVKTAESLSRRVSDR